MAYVNLFLIIITTINLNFKVTQEYKHYGAHCELNQTENHEI